MGKIINSYILPHPPIIVPEIGQNKAEAAADTVRAVERAAAEIAKDNPSTIILSSPHSPCFRDFVYIANSEYLFGNFAAFGKPKLEFHFENNCNLIADIVKNAELDGIKAGTLSSRIQEQYGIPDTLDHGALVPLYFIRKEFIRREIGNCKLILISTPFIPLVDLYRFGRCIAGAVNSSAENVVYVASGDLSHRLTVDAPAGYNPKGREYDQYLIARLKETAVEDLLNIDENFMEAAGECGTRSFVMMLGALDGLKIKTDIFSYEGPFGVGYLVAKISSPGRDEENSNLENYLYNKKKGLNNLRQNESDYVKLARETVETFVKEKRKITMPPGISPELLNRRAGVFVSIKKNGRLRGCIGTISPVRKNIAEEIINNAISSGTEDPRFRPVSKEELADLIYSVDVLGEPEKISSLQELDINRYGVIVSSGLRRGLLLPDLEGVESPEQQVAIALQKAGIGNSEKYELERFEVIRYK
ncbi:MAG: AmmeMemoRadiSam system protein A [Desulfitobacteriaceae bacterium]|nr:AmmeMemoRadiSam system protein A [Desulfitobacteriaceae bacterium]MDD4346485.1 AmmeMemoRadiSam system protein A [Desulfitobacteriaceae bacterium]MDD4401856.1 AmmeMemoRadiSam system protein A [Desulfitobacteriaceae bacterium]